jgi:hypothetical protein
MEVRMEASAAAGKRKKVVTIAVIAETSAGAPPAVFKEEFHLSTAPMPARITKGPARTVGTTNVVCKVSLPANDDPNSAFRHLDFSYNIKPLSDPSPERDRIQGVFKLQGKTEGNTHYFVVDKGAVDPPYCGDGTLKFEASMRETGGWLPALGDECRRVFTEPRSESGCGQDWSLILIALVVIAALGGGFWVLSRTD